MIQGVNCNRGTIRRQQLKAALSGPVLVECFKLQTVFQKFELLLVQSFLLHSFSSEGHAGPALILWVLGKQLFIYILHTGCVSFHRVDHFRRKKGRF